MTLTPWTKTQLQTYKHLLRPNTIDEYVVKHIESEYAMLLPVEGKAVLDIGGHMGWFSRYALDNGAASVTACEPVPENIALYKQLCPTATLIEAAVVEHGGAVMTLNLPRGGSKLRNTGMGSFYKRARGETLDVPTVSFQGVVNDVQPHVIKIDCEGAEMLFLRNVTFPDCVQRIGGELHGTSQLRDQWAMLAANMLRNGFKQVTQFDGKWNLSTGFSCVEIVLWDRQ